MFRTIGYVIGSAVALVLIALALKIFLPGWLVAHIAAISVIVWALGVVYYLAGNTPPWAIKLGIFGYLVFVGLSYVHNQRPWLWDAWAERMTFGSYQATDAVKPGEALELRRELYAKKLSRLAKEENRAIEALRSASGKDAEAAAERELRAIEQERRTVQMLGGASPSPNTGSTGNYGGAASFGDAVVIDHPGTYAVKPEGGPITMRVKGCYHLEWDAKNAPIVINHNGLRYIEPVGIQQVDIKGNVKEFQVSNLEGKEGEFVVVASLKR